MSLNRRLPVKLVSDSSTFLLAAIDLAWSLTRTTFRSISRPNPTRSVLEVGEQSAPQRRARLTLLLLLRTVRQTARSGSYALPLKLQPHTKGRLHQQPTTKVMAADDSLLDGSDEEEEVVRARASSAWPALSLPPWKLTLALLSIRHSASQTRSTTKGPDRWQIFGGQDEAVSGRLDVNEEGCSRSRRGEGPEAGAQAGRAGRGG